jgi:putative oxidoreductase
MTVSRLIARPMLASMFLVGGFNAVRNADKLAVKAAPVTDRVVPLVKRAVPSLPIPSDPVTLVRLNGAVQLTAGAALATGRVPRVSAAVLALSALPVTAAGHRFWRESDPAVRAQQRVHFFKNVSMLGGLVIAAGDTEGKPGVAWRTRRAAKDARREARHLATAARREAKLAKARVT